MPPYLSRIFVAFSALAALNVSAHAAETTGNQSLARVKLTVSASGGIRDAVSQCLDRELRTLHDVQMVNDTPEWEISVLALSVQSTRGYRGGIAMSAVFLPRFDNEKIARLFQSTGKTAGLAQTSNLWERPGHYLHIDASDRLEVMCKQVAADFEARKLDRNRTQFPETQEPAKSPAETR